MQIPGIPLVCLGGVVGAPGNIFETAGTLLATIQVNAASFTVGLRLVVSSGCVCLGERIYFLCTSVLCSACDDGSKSNLSDLQNVLEVYESFKVGKRAARLVLALECHFNATLRSGERTSFILALCKLVRIRPCLPTHVKFTATGHPNLPFGAGNHGSQSHQARKATKKQVTSKSPCKWAHGSMQIAGNSWRY